MKISGKAVASGSGTAAKTRERKRKAYQEDEDSDLESATVPSFHPPVQESATQVRKSSSSNLSAHWAASSKLSAQRQAEIDYYLLRFVICCSIAFSILDSRFFIDFLTCLLVLLLLLWSSTNRTLLIKLQVTILCLSRPLSILC